jgi:hypothetical protein
VLVVAVGLLSAPAAWADYQPGMPPDIDPGTPTCGDSPTPVPPEPGAPDATAPRLPRPATALRAGLHVRSYPWLK